MCGRSQLEAARSRGAARSRDPAAESDADIWVAEAARRVSAPTAFVAHAAPVQIEAAAGLGSSVAGGGATGGDAAEYGAIGGVAAEDGAADDGAARFGATQRSECDNRPKGQSAIIVLAFSAGSGVQPGSGSQPRTSRRKWRRHPDRRGSAPRVHARRVRRTRRARRSSSRLSSSVSSWSPAPRPAAAVRAAGHARVLPMKWTQKE